VGDLGAAERVVVPGVDWWARLVWVLGLWDLEVWDRRVHLATSEYARAATSRSYPQFVEFAD
jgi:hypothetical protein